MVSMGINNRDWRGSPLLIGSIGFSKSAGPSGIVPFVECVYYKDLICDKQKTWEHWDDQIWGDKGTFSPSLHWQSLHKSSTTVFCLLRLILLTENVTVIQ